MTAGRVLVVDDAPDLRLLGRTVLASAGFAVDVAPGGREALARMAGGEVPDIVVLDVQMPEMDGWDTLAAIRSDPATAATPVVLCTVKEHPRDQLRACELGADGYIAKPFGVRDFVSVVTEVAQRSNEERARLRAVRLEEAVRRLSGSEENTPS
jgi:two-component system KDP operon response regulator KdpE